MAAQGNGYKLQDNGLLCGACSAGWLQLCCCSKIAEAEAGVSVNEKKWLVMHMHVQLDGYSCV